MPNNPIQKRRSSTFRSRGGCCTDARLKRASGTRLTHRSRRSSDSKIKRASDFSGTHTHNRAYGVVHADGPLSHPAPMLPQQSKPHPFCLVARGTDAPRSRATPYLAKAKRARRRVSAQNIQTRTSEPRPLAEGEPAPAAAGRGEKEPTPTQSSVAHSAENKTTMPAAAAGTPLLRFLAPFLFLIPARTLSPVVVAPSVSTAALAGEGRRKDMAAFTTAPAPAVLEGSLRLLASLGSCGFSFPPLDLLGFLFLINED